MSAQSIDRQPDSRVSSALTFGVEQIQVALVVYDATGGLVASNARARALLGLSEDVLAGRAPRPEGWEFLAPDGAPLSAEREPARLALASGEGVEDATVGLRIAGAEPKWLRVSCDVQRDERGAVARVVTTYVDVTAERRTELALREGEARYRALFDSMDAAVLLMRGAACVECNPATVRLFGAAGPEQILGKTPLDFAPPVQPSGMSSLDVVQQNIARALQDGTHAFEWLSSRVDGTPMYLEVRFTPVPVGEGLFQCIAFDITERKRAEEALRASEARFRAIIERAAEGVAVAEVGSRRLRYANPALCRMLGYEPHELLALRANDLHPADAQAQVDQSFRRQADGSLPDVQLPCKRRDGSVFEASVRAVPLVLDDMPCLVGFFTDRTVSQLLEAEQLKTQKLEALGTLAGGIAHDFNNLLQAVLGCVSVARQVRHDEAELLTMLDESERALTVASRLTGQLLTFSRGGKPVKRRLAIGPAVEAAVRFALSGSHTGSRFEIAAPLPEVEADEAQLAQALQNIVHNASQAMAGAGVVAVSVREVSAPSPDLPAALPPGAHVAIAVVDAGSGIAPGRLGRIFDPYFTSTQGKSGLGLATAHSIVKSHGGLIDVRSRPGEGSTFTVYLPAASAPAPVVRAPAVDTTARRPHLLLMDDEPMVRTAAARLLKLVGYDVEVAADGAAAVQAYSEAFLSEHPFDLVVLDLTVPGGMGGLEALQHLRAIDPAVRAVASSGYSDDGALSEYAKHGFGAFLAKPYGLDTLKSTLAGLLD